MVLKTFARSMRAAPTDAEAVIWRQLRAHRFVGNKFKRQQPIGKYIVDFVCFEAKLVVEVDGGQHNESVADSIRDAWLESQGFVVLRFWNNEVMQNLEGVLMRILELLAPSPQPLSHEGRGAKSASSNADASFASLSPRGRGWSRGFEAHALRLRNGQPMQRLARPARIEGEGER